MKITNKHGLPQPLVVAAMDDLYDRGESDISVTQLIDAPRRRIMAQAYGDEAEMDVTQRMWPMLGTSFHTLMERGGDEHDCITEERLFLDVDGWTLSGAIDRVNDVSADEPVLQDYKVTSVFTVMAQRDEWENQLNCYLHLFRQTYMARNSALKAPRLEIIALCRDWRPNEVDRMANYPREPVVRIRIPSWMPDYAERYVQSRIQLHQQAQEAYDETGHIWPCSEEDMWTRPDHYAGYRSRADFERGAKAIKKFPTREQALGVPAVNHVEKRFGEDVRCESYCEFSRVCSQHIERKKTRDAEAVYQEVMR